MQFYHLGILTVMALLSLTDLWTFQIPNRMLLLQLPLIALGWRLQGGFSWIFAGSRFMACLFGGGLCRICRLGGGDCKLVAVSGLLLGFTPLIHALWIAGACILFYVILRRLIDQIPFQEPIPLGPFINLGVLLIYSLSI